MTSLAHLSDADLETEAQQAAERRLAYGNATAFQDDEDVDPDEEFPGEQLAGPFCGCDTCIVREVLDAAWPFMQEMARRESGAEPQSLPRCVNCHRVLPREWAGVVCARCAHA